MKNLNSYVFMVFSVLCMSCSKGKDDTSTPINNEDSTLIESDIWYVSPNGSGDKTGATADDAADFLSDIFWDKIRKKLLEEPITVQFLDGEYGRAYTEKPLVLDKIGHPKHKLIIKGGKDVIFTLKEGVKTKSYVVDVRGAQNIVIDGLHFTGDGSINYVLRFTRVPGGGMPTTNITLRNSSFIDMEGIIYGATGCSYEETSHITFKRDTFMRIGESGTAHMIYNAYGSDHIYVIESYFEDCRGDYVRFRDDCDYGFVKACTFLKSSEQFSGRAFISMPLFNSREPVGDEYFATNYAFIDNKFKNTSFTEIDYAMKFHQSGFSPPEWDYLLTKSEGDILTSGTSFEKKNLLLNNFGINTDSVRVHGNTFSSRIKHRFVLTTRPAYGAKNKGFSGTGDIYNIINKQTAAFDWEP